MPRLVTIDQISASFSEAGCVLLDEKYVNNASPLRYLCSCGREAVTTWARFRRGSRCAGCAAERGNKARCADAESVRRAFVAQGCELLGEYVNSYTPVRYRCSCGTEATIRFFSFQAGKRCRRCFSARNGGQAH